jgi:hypothetical protein
MQEAVPGTFEMQRHRLKFFTWNAGHLTRSGSEPFSATRTHSLLMEYLFSVHCQILLLQEANLLDAVTNRRSLPSHPCLAKRSLLKRKMGAGQQ